jgi:septum formation protein
MKSTPTDQRIILASKSPRRRYLLEQAGLRLEVVPSRVDESRFRLSRPESYVRELAEAKAREVSERHPRAWVIGADTIVAIDGAILGKPASAAEAESMLARLSGRTHRVLTGYCICCRSRQRHVCEVATTEVRFKFLSKAEIGWYIRTREPFDKAGAYAIQGIGTFLVKSISGSYTNVVGLPVCEVIEYLIAEQVVGYEGDSRPIPPSAGGGQ